MLSDLLAILCALAGFAAVVGGLWAIYPPVGLIATGVLLIHMARTLGGSP